MKTLIFFIVLLLMPLVVMAQTDQTDYTASDEDKNRLVFIGQGEIPERIDQIGASNSVIVINESLLVPLFMIRQEGDRNRALVFQISADSTFIGNSQNRVRIKQKGNGNNSTVIQQE
jgi:hypothetical protein